jgi:hypothetical protein
MDIAVLASLIENFATNLGLQLQARIKDPTALPVSHRRMIEQAEQGLTTWAAWHTDRGIATLRVEYQAGQSARVGANVLLFKWWIGTEHHESCWHCYPKFPHDWIKGFGAG